MNESPQTPSGGSPAMHKGSIIQFKLASLFAWMAVVSVALLVYREYFVPQQPIVWETYTEKKLSASIQAGRLVLVDFGADWDNTGALLRRTILNHPDVVRAIRERRVVTLVVDFTHAGPHTLELRGLEKVGLTSIPALALYRGSDLAPQAVFQGLYTAEQVLAEIR